MFYLIWILLSVALGCVAVRIAYKKGIRQGYKDGVHSMEAEWDNLIIREYGSYLLNHSWKEP